MFSPLLSVSSLSLFLYSFFFFFNDTATPEIYTLSLHDALPIFLSDWADLHYKVTQNYDAHDEGGLVWNDPDIAIEWPIREPIVSDRDNAFSSFKDLAPHQLPQTPEFET